VFIGDQQKRRSGGLTAPTSALSVFRSVDVLDRVHFNALIRTLIAPGKVHKEKPTIRGKSQSQRIPYVPVGFFVVLEQQMSCLGVQQDHP
jgi:hypothetical protein